MEEDVQIWLYDTSNKNKLTGTIRVPNGQELQPGQTAIRPADGLYGTPMFDTDNQRWFGEDKGEWLKKHPIPVPKPSAQQIAIAGLMKDMAALKASNDDDGQAKLNAGLMKQMAQMKLTTDAQIKAQAQINASAMKDIAKLKIALASQAQPTQPTVQPTEATQPTQPQTTNKEEA